MPDQAACLSRALAYYPERVRKTAPLIHCITNYVTAGDVANLLLAAGASPVMTDHPAETASTASASDGLVLNLGTLKIGSVTAMIRAGQAANRKGISIRSASVCPPTADTPPAGFCRTSPSPSCGEIHLKSGRWRICLDIRWRRNSTE